MGSCKAGGITCVLFGKFLLIHHCKITGYPKETTRLPPKFMGRIH